MRLELDFLLSVGANESAGRAGIAHPISACAKVVHWRDLCHLLEIGKIAIVSSGYTVENLRQFNARPITF